MTLLDEVNLGKKSIKFWHGIDIEKILAHSNKGDDGLMIVIIESINQEIRNSKIESIINNKVYTVENLLSTLDNNYICIYQTSGSIEPKVMVDILKQKYDDVFKPSILGPIKGFEIF
jgi:hypothetical protein